MTSSSGSPQFSVLIANYNNGRFLRDAIASVRAQTASDWEIVIVDDGSTDDSREILVGYNSDPRIRVFENDRNYGCGYTKHRCAEMATGEFCGYLDPDDALEPGALETMANVLTERSDCVLAYSRYFLCDALLNTRGISTHQCTIPDGKSYLEVGGGAVSHWAMFRRESYLKSGGIDPKFKRAVDQDLYYKLEETGALVFVDRPLYRYRAHSGNISLGDNREKALSWHIVAVCDAIGRRELDPERILPVYLHDNWAHRIERLVIAPLRKAKQTVRKLTR